MARCKNPECKNGRTPGISVIPKPKPQIGSTTRWAWVPCPLCHPDPKVKFNPKKRTPDEIEARADLADRKATYTVEKPSDQFAKLRAAPQQQLEEEDNDPPVNGYDHHAGRQVRQPMPAPAPDSNVILNLTEALNKSLAQQAILQAENTELRQKLAEATAPLAFGSASGLGKSA